MTDIDKAFRLGYDYGVSCRQVTPRLAEMNLRMEGMETNSDNVTAFCKGATDGLIGEPFRRESI